MSIVNRPSPPSINRHPTNGRFQPVARPSVTLPPPAPSHITPAPVPPLHPSASVTPAGGFRTPSVTAQPPKPPFVVYPPSK